MKTLFGDFTSALARLREVLEMPKTDVVRDSAIKRFELCFDVCWKNMKECARQEGEECNSPSSCIKTAYRLGLIPYDEKWLDMLKDRNTSVHIYKISLAEEVYGKIPSYIPLFEYIHGTLKQRMTAQDSLI